jgi:hypothetical protein
VFQVIAVSIWFKSVLLKAYNLPFSKSPTVLETYKYTCPLPASSPKTITVLPGYAFLFNGTAFSPLNLPKAGFTLFWF